MNALVLSMILHGVAIYGYEFTCPDLSHRRIYSKAACPNPLDFACLLDVLVNEYRTHCFVSRPVGVGYKYVFRPWYDREPCISSRYQPFVFERKNQTDCIYLKSSCNEEGQITYSNGSTTSDVKCKCDEKNGYTFVTPPRDNISCIPSEEDCSCYRKPNTAIDAVTFAQENPTISIPSLNLRNNKFDDTKYNIKGIEHYRQYCATSLTATLCCIIIIYLLVVVVWKRKKLTELVYKYKTPSEREEKVPSVSTKDELQEDAVPVQKTEELFQHFDKELTVALHTEVLDELISMFVVMIDDRHEIMGQATPYQRNRSLLDLLIRRPYPTFLLLVDALEASEPDNKDVQDLVRRMRNHKEESYTLQEEQVLTSGFERKAKLQKKYRSIVRNLNMSKIIDPLVASNCLRKEEYESIKALTDNYAQIRSFIDILSKKGKHSFNKFLEALKTDRINKDLADKIEGSELTPLEIFRFNTGVKDLHTREAIRRMGIPWNKYEKMEKKIKMWKEDDKLFINTKASAEVMKRVKEQNCVVITGNSGSGKTYIAHHTALMMKEEGYIIVPADKPDEIRQYHKSGTKTIFVFDDMFGRFTLNQTLFDDWESSLQSIESVLKVDHCKMLATCRLQVFSDEQIRLKVKFLKESECNICSKLLSLDNEERKHFAQKYFKGYDDSYACLPSEFDFFPLICKLFKDKEFRDLQKCLNNPFQVIKEDIEALFSKEGKKKCCGLVLCLLFNNELTDGKLMSDEMLPCIQDVFEKCHLSGSESRDEVQSLLKQMEGVYISITEGKYRIIHDKLFDFLTSHFGNKMTSLFIEHSDPECIRERFVWTGDKILEDQERMYIRIDTIDTMRQYHTRLKINLTKGYIRSALGNRNMKSEVFRNDFLRFLQEDTECQWVNKTDNNENGRTPLFQICFYNDSDFCKWLLDLGANVNLRLKDNATPLHVACQEGYIEIVKLLIQHSADINLTTNKGFTPIERACHNNRIDVVRELIQCQGIDINKANDKGYTPLHVACNEGYIEIVRLLINHSADINLTTNEGDSPIKTSCNKNRIDVVGELLQCVGIDINKANDKGFTPLHAACQEGNIEIVRLLINHSAGINLTTKKGVSPLKIACHKNRIDVVGKLLQCKSIDIDKADDKGFTPLYVVCQEGYIEIVRLLINHSADINLTTKKDTSPLKIACHKNRIDVVGELLQCESIVINKADDKGFTPLHAACQDGYIEIVRLLINHSADINLTTNEGDSPLVMACNNNRLDVVRELLQCEGIDINKADDKGFTPLHVVCQQGYIEIVRLLINHSADINVTTIVGVSPIETACHNNRIDIVRELIKCAGIDINKANAQGFTPMHAACQDGYIEIVKLLINHSADINLTTNEGDTPLKSACNNNRIDVVSELLKCEGIDINKADVDGFTPLHVACLEGYIEIVRLLINHADGINKINKKNGATPLYMACQNGHVQVVKLLINHLADINLTANKGVTPLKSACNNNRIDVVRELLQCEGIEINKADNNDETALFGACQEGHTDIVKLLLQQSIDIGKSNKHGATPLSTACQNKHIDVVTLLKQHTSDM